MIHQLKTESSYFLEVASGKKTFEVRKNDREFCVGDFLGLNETNEIALETGRFILAEITYILTNSDFVKDGYAILGIKPCTVCRKELIKYQIFNESN